MWFRLQGDPRGDPRYFYYDYDYYDSYDSYHYYYYYGETHGETHLWTQKDKGIPVRGPPLYHASVSKLPVRGPILDPEKQSDS